MKECADCGFEEQDDEAVYCPECGSPLHLVKYMDSDEHHMGEKHLIEKKVYRLSDEVAIEDAYQCGYKKGYKKGHSKGALNTLITLACIGLIIVCGLVAVFPIGPFPPDDDDHDDPETIGTIPLEVYVLDFFTYEGMNFTLKVFDHGGIFYGPAYNGFESVIISSYPGDGYLSMHYGGPAYIDAVLHIEADGYYTRTYDVEYYFPPMYEENAPPENLGVFWLSPISQNYNLTTGLVIGGEDAAPFGDMPMLEFNIYNFDVGTSLGEEPYYDYTHMTMVYRNIIVLKYELNSSLVFTNADGWIWDSTYLYPTLTLPTVRDDINITDDGMKTRRIGFNCWGDTNVTIMFFKEISENNIYNCQFAGADYMFDMLIPAAF